MTIPSRPLVRSIKEKCRVCYTCVRECPAKAIRISQGQAEVIEERCIGCGNCVRVCTQNAKEVADDIGTVEQLLASGKPVTAIVAPTFPVVFDGADYRVFVGYLKALGFATVHEVAFGADLVARAYRELLDTNPGKRYIATTCPALVNYVEYYLPELVPFFAPIVSPMIATARAVRVIHGSDRAIVFIGPCIAKKVESMRAEANPGIDAVLTFTELDRMLAARPETVAGALPCAFDPPGAGSGRLFPLVRGLLQAAGIKEDLMTADVVAADGRENFVEALREFESGTMQAHLLEVLCCQGCIMGAGIEREQTMFQRRSKVSAYARERASGEQAPQPEYDWSELDLSRTYRTRDRRMQLPPEDRIAEVLLRMGKDSPGDLLNCGACGYETCRAHAVAVVNGLAESEMCLPHTIDQLRRTVADLASSNTELASTQNALIQSEKMASMGQLAAGIAHEVNNPLGVVLMYAHLLLEQMQSNQPASDDIRMIVEQADRCKKIVSGLLNFARQSRTVRQPVDIHTVIDRSLRLVHFAPEIATRVEYDSESAMMVEVDADQMVQVLVNLFTNAAAAMPTGGTLTVETSSRGDRLEISVSDTGVGIPPANRARVFEPFFTTKQIGKGTGLGLAITYGIIKMHSGDIKVESNADPVAGPTGTRFTVSLPRGSAAPAV